MRDEAGYIITTVLAGLFAMVGLFLWAKAEDVGMVVFGTSLLVFGLAFVAANVKAWCDWMEPQWAEDKGR